MTSHHPRNVLAMQNSVRCGARTRAGGVCKCPAVTGLRRCRMHGGAKGSGGRTGNQNAFRHGVFSKENTLIRQANRELIRLVKETLADPRLR